MINKIELNQKSIYLHPTDHVEVKQIIYSLQKNKSPGHDKITTKALQLSAEFISKPLAEIFNKCLLTGYFPKNLKKTIVVPIHKNGPVSELNNYRPISIITSLTKVFEKIINTRLNSFLEKNKILSPHQFGFRKNTSTNDAIATLTDLIYKSVDD